MKKIINFDTSIYCSLIPLPLLKTNTSIFNIAIQTEPDWLVVQYNMYISVAAPGGFLGFLETSQDSGSTDQIVNTDGPLPAAVTVNKTP